MKKFISERNLVIILFIAALTVFSFAQEDAKKAEKIYQDNSIGSSLLALPKQTADNGTLNGKPVITINR